MPTFNSAPYVCESINSVLAQSYGACEIIVVDDGSKDGTPDIITRHYKHDARVVMHTSQSNRGAAAARNIGIEAARGRFIAFLDSDDLWRPNKLAVQIPFLESTDACMVFSEYDLIRGPDWQVVRTVKVPQRLFYNDLLKSQPVGCLTAIYDTNKTGKIYMPDIRMRQDWGLWLRLLRRGGWALGVQQSLALLRLREGSLSANKMRATYFNYKLLRTEGGLDPVRATLAVGRHALAAIGRRSGVW